MYFVESFWVKDLLVFLVFNKDFVVISEFVDYFLFINNLKKKDSNILM